MTITNFGNAAVLEVLPWSSHLMFFVGGLVSVIVQVRPLFPSRKFEYVFDYPQGFFAWRIHKVSTHWYVTALSWAGSTARLAVTLAICVLDFGAGTISRYEAHLRWTIPLSLGIGMAVDLLNSAALCYYLWRSPKVTRGWVHPSLDLGFDERKWLIQDVCIV